MDPRSKIFRKAPRSIRTRSVVLMKKAAELHHLGAQVTLTIRVDGEIITLNPHYTKDVPCSAEQLNREGNATGRRARLLDEPAHTVELTALAACGKTSTNSVCLAHHPSPGERLVWCAGQRNKAFFSTN